MMKTVMAVKHVAFEDLGSFEDVLVKNGFMIEYVDACTEDVYSKYLAANPDLLVVLGGPVSVYDQEEYPFLSKEVALLQRRMIEKKPTLGICLGAQLIAAALGGRVFSSGLKEIGWKSISLSPAAEDSSMRYLGNAPVFHWHGDTFTLPDGATLLASSDVCHNQAFSFGDNVLALQFHPELKAARIESWLVGHACELSNVKDVTVHQLREDTSRYGALLENQAKQFFNAWLSKAIPA